MNGTSGPRSRSSSASAALQTSLANRLRAGLDVNGSVEFLLTWKEWAMPSGVPICALRASRRPKLGNDFFGWPAPQAGSKATAKYNEGGNTDSARRTVGLAGGRVAKSELKEYDFAGWAAPARRDYRAPNRKSYKERGGGKKGEQLPNQVLHLAIGTPSTSSSAPMGKPGALSPEFSRWLMGFPTDWSSYAPMATRSSRKSRPSSSKPISKPLHKEPT